MKLPLIFFTVLFFLIIFLRWRASKPKEEKVEQPKEPSKPDRGRAKSGKWSVSTAGIIAIIVFIVVAACLYNWVNNCMYPKVPGIAELPICAESYDFSSTKVADVVEMSFRTDCRTAVKLPFCTTPIIDPDAKVKIRFMNGTEVVDGPGPEYQNWVKYKPGNESFMIYGLSQSGTAKISIDREG